jgi:hypothetical protein
MDFRYVDDMRELDEYIKQRRRESGAEFSLRRPKRRSPIGWGYAAEREYITAMFKYYMVHGTGLELVKELVKE